MKTLKFMLAAATAIGLASASQAVGPYGGSTDFEADTLNSTITTSGSYWTVPAGAEDGDYTIVAGVPNAALRSAGATAKFATTPAQVLQLEGGTEPLTRNIQSSGAAVDLTAGDVYVDTLVKFTVTPSGDTVTNSAADKLLIYLQEDLTSGSECTNLVVIAAKHTPYNDDDDIIPEANVPTPVVVANNVLPDTWYRLTVMSFVKKDAANRNVPVFKIFLNGSPLSASESLFLGGVADLTLFPSLQGSNNTTLTAVGFAGSGSVDDLLFTTFDPALSVLDFYLVLDGAVAGLDGDVSYVTTADSGTLDFGTNTVYCYSGSPSVTVTYDLNDGYTAAWDTNPNGATITAGSVYTLTVTQTPTGVDFTLTLGTGVSSVTWTVNGASETVNATKTYTALEPGSYTLGAVTYADWYVAGTVKEGSTITVSSESASTTVDAVKATAAEIITDSTTAADLGITNPKFTSDTSAQLAKLAAWAQGLNTPLTIAQVNAMTFADGDLNSEAFLLNCENNAEAVAAAKAAFKFSSITPGTVPSVDEPANGYNVTPVIYGGNTVDAINVTPATGSHKFYKAVLTK